MSIDAPTSAFYDRWAVDGEEADRGAVSRHFDAAFVPGSRVLDVGCGKGRDVLALLEMGFDAYGVEPNDAMRARALARDPRMPDRVAAASLPHLGLPFGGGFDAVSCSAVLMHLPDEDLAPAFDAIVAVLRPSGRVLLALPQMREDWLVDGRDPDQRHFTNHSPDHVTRLLADRGLTRMACTELATPDTHTLWRVMQFERC